MAVQNIGLGLDYFNRSKIYNASETVATDIFMLLMNKPGFYPSNPKLGMDIPSMLYNIVDNRTPQMLKQQLVLQCRHYQNVIQGGDFRVEYVANEFEQNPFLVFSIPTVYNDEQNHLIFAMRREGDTIRYNYGWTKEQIV